jgi:AcrR family transcriptional regulator
VPKVSEEHKRQVRRHLLDAAWRVVGRDGVEATTTRAILDEAAMSAGALYSYFPSKDELLRVLTEEKVNETLALVAAQGDPDEDERGLLMRFAVGLLSQPSRHPELVAFRNRLSADPEVNDNTRAVNRSMVERFAPLVEAAQRSGGFDRRHDAEALVELVDIVVDGLNRRHLGGTFATSFERVGQIAIALFLGTLQPPLPSSSPQPQPPGDTPPQPREHGT